MTKDALLNCHTLMTFVLQRSAFCGIISIHMLFHMPHREKFQPMHHTSCAVRALVPYLRWIFHTRTIMDPPPPKEPGSLWSKCYICAGFMRSCSPGGLSSPVDAALFCAPSHELEQLGSQKGQTESRQHQRHSSRGGQTSLLQTTPHPWIRKCCLAAFIWSWSGYTAVLQEPVYGSRL